MLTLGEFAQRYGQQQALWEMTHTPPQNQQPLKDAFEAVLEALRVSRGLPNLPSVATLSVATSLHECGTQVQALLRLLREETIDAMSK